MSEQAAWRGEMPVEYASRLEDAWKRAIAEGDRGLALEAARAAQARFQQDGVDGVTPLLDPDFELHMQALFLDGRVYHGVEGLREWRRDIEDTFEYDRFDVRAVRQGVDLLVQIGRLYIKGRTSAVEVDLPLAYVIRVRNEKIVRLTMYSDVDQALADACLTPEGEPTDRPD